MYVTASVQGFFRAAAAATLLLLAGGSGAVAQPAAETSGAKGCAENTGLKLPAGFCASIFADNIGHARHLVVAGNGVVYVNTWSGRYYGNDKPHAGGFLVALQDTGGIGKADVIKRFGETLATGGHGGTGIALYEGGLYAESNDQIVRYALRRDSIAPDGAAEIIVSGLPLSGDHPMHPFVIDADGLMYVDVASATNACQEKNRVLESPGIQPCTELETRAGIWRYDAKRRDQRFSPAERYATGIRNADGIALDSSGRGVYATQHGRDQLSQNWPKLYQPEQGATLPDEELLHVVARGDYGWPECYYDGVQEKLVLAPEYGGDGGHAVGICASKLPPVASFPGHWAPNDLALYYGMQFPARYRGGAFIAFHGSWNRAPFPQGGYNVVYQPLTGGKAAGPCEIFADGFAGRFKDPGRAAHRPTGLAVAPDGALYISDDAHGRIYRIAYRGDSGDAAASGTPCPSPSEPAGAIGATSATPPEGTHPNAGAAEARLPVPPGSTPAAVALGERIYRGEVGGAPCTGCHGSDGSGSPLGPPLTANKWQWGDGSVAGIAKTIAAGVPQPKAYRGPMPPMGGAQLTAQQISALAAYVWSLSHRGTK
ncbi:MAG TPA: c-type cytochrome [Steroidobacteraceae bacterium]|nr:c-type cytochrome [Steroidobacteraceae bacterium]